MYLFPGAFGLWSSADTMLLTQDLRSVGVVTYSVFGAWQKYGAVVVVVLARCIINVWRRFD